MSADRFRSGVLVEALEPKLLLSADIIPIEPPASPGDYGPSLFSQSLYAQSLEFDPERLRPASWDRLTSGSGGRATLVNGAQPGASPSGELSTARARIANPPRDAQQFQAPDLADVSSAPFDEGDLIEQGDAPGAEQPDFSARIDLDLVAQDFTATGDAIAGETLDLAWRVGREGDAAPQNGWSDRVYLSQDENLDRRTDALIGAWWVDASSLADRDATYNTQHTVRLPDGWSGPAHLILDVDGADRALERNESNNTIAVAIDILGDGSLTDLDQPRGGPISSGSLTIEIGGVEIDLAEPLRAGLVGNGDVEGLLSFSSALSAFGEFGAAIDRLVGSVDAPDVSIASVLGATADHLGLGAIFSDSLAAALETYLDDLGTGEDATLDGIASAFEDLAETPGAVSATLDFEQIDDEISIPRTLEITFDFSASSAAAIMFDASIEPLPGSGVEVSGMASASATAAVSSSLAIGLDLNAIVIDPGAEFDDPTDDTVLPLEEWIANAFYLRTDGLDIALDATASDINASASAGFFEASVVGGSAAFDLDLTIDLANLDEDPDDRLTLSELLGASLDSVATITIHNAALDATLPLEGSIGTFSIGASALVEITDDDVFDDLLPAISGSDINADVGSFRNANASEIADLFAQLSTTLGSLTPSGPFNLEIPFVDLSIGEVLDFGEAFTDQIQSFLRDGDEIDSDTTFGGAQSLSSRLAAILGVSDAEINANFDPVSEELTFNINFTHDFVSVMEPLSFNLDLDPLGSVGTADGSMPMVEINARAIFDMIVGVDFSPLGEELNDQGLAFTAGLALAMLNGGRGVRGVNERQTTNAQDGGFNTVELRNTPELRFFTRDGASFDVTIPDGNDPAAPDPADPTVGELASLIESASAGAVTVELDAERYAFRFIDNTAGSDLFRVEALNESFAAIDLGILALDDDGDGVIEGEPLHGQTLLDRFFIEDVSLTGEATLSATDIDIEALLGFFEINAMADASVQAVVSTGLHAPGDPGNSRLTLTDLGRGIAGSLGNDALRGEVDEDPLPVFGIVTTPTLAGSAQLDLELAASAGDLIDLGGVTLHASIGDLSNPQDITLDTSGLDVGELLDSIQNLSFDSFTDGLVQGLRFLADVIGPDASFPAPIADLLDFELPFLEKSISELIRTDGSGQTGPASFFDDIADAIDQPGETLQSLGGAIAAALGIPVLDEAGEQNGDEGLLILVDEAAETIEFRINYTPLNVAPSAPFTLDIVELLGLDDSAVGDLIGASGEGIIGADLDISVDLDLGIDISESSPRAFIRDTSGFTVEATADAEAIFTASIGPFGISLGTDGDPSTIMIGPATWAIGLEDETGAGADGRYFLSDLSASLIEVDFTTGGASVSLPIYADLPAPLDAIDGPVLVDTLAFSIPDILNFDLSTIDVELPNFENLLNGGFSGDIGGIVDGLDLVIGAFDLLLDNDILELDLPIVGNSLADAKGVLSDIRSGLVLLRTALTEGGMLAAEAVFGILGPDGYTIPLTSEFIPGLDIIKDITGDGQVVLGEDFILTELDEDDNGQTDGFMFEFELGDTIVLTPPVIDLGIPALGFLGNIDIPFEIVLDFSARLAFGVQRDIGFFFETSDDSEIELSLQAGFPGGMIGGQLGFLELLLSDDRGEDGMPGTGDETPSNVGVTLGIDLIDTAQRGADNRLTFAEISAGSLTDFVNPFIQGGAFLNLDFELGGSTGDYTLPSITTDFVLNWDLSWDFDGGLVGSAPTISFENIALDLGFITEFISPVIDSINSVIEPIQPFLDILTARIPVLSDLFGRKVDLLTLAEWYNPRAKTEFVRDVLKIIKEFPETLSAIQNTGVIEFGSFTIGQGSTTEDGDPVDLRDLPSLSQVKATVSQTASDINQQLMNPMSGAGNFVNSYRGLEGGGFSIPIIEDPASVIGLLLGQNVDLFRYDTPRLFVGFEFSKGFSIFGPLFARLGINFDITAQFAFGYDTLGIRNFADNLTPDDPSDDFSSPFLLADGFFISDVDANGVDIPEVVLSGGVSIGAEINLAVARAGVSGGIQATVRGDLNAEGIEDFDGDPTKLRLEAALETLFSDPFGLINISGEIVASLRAYLVVELDLAFTTITLWDEEWELARIVLIRFPAPQAPPPPPPDLGVAAPGDPSTLRLSFTPENDSFTVTQTASDTWELKRGRRTQTITGNFTSLEAWTIDESQSSGPNITYIGNAPSAGNGNDSLTVQGAGGVVVAAALDYRGGAGNDKLVYTGTGAVNARGDDGDDTLTGGDGNDILRGNAGRDEIYGMGGNDTLRGDDGDDILTGGDGDDSIFGNEGNDNLFGEAGNDTLRGGLGDDRITGDAGDDLILGQDGRDTLDGGDGYDWIVGGSEADVINGGRGVDVLWGDDAAVEYNAQQPATPPAGPIGNSGSSNDGDDRIVGGEDASADFIYAGGGNDRIESGAGNDYISSGDGDDIVRAGLGDDQVFAGIGRDLVYGDRGDDLIDTAHDPADADLGGVDDVVFGGLENSPNNSGNDVIRTGRGDDIIDAGDGDDFIVAGAGDDAITAGTGDDTVFADDAPAGIDEQDFAGLMPGDTPPVAELADSGSGDDGDDTVDAGEGTNWIYAANGSDVVTSGTGADYVSLGDGANTLNAGDGDNRVIGGTGVDHITTGAGADFVNARQGDDMITTGAGADWVIGGTGADRIDTGQGSDVVWADLAAPGFSAPVPMPTDQNGRPVLPSTPDGDAIYSGFASSSGSDGADRVTAGDGVDWIFGAGGDDELSGGADNDYIDTGDGDDVASGELGSDTILGGAGEDRLYGGFGPAGGGLANDVDVIYGGLNSDRIWGGAGDDMIAADSDPSLTADPFDFTRSAPDRGDSGQDLVDGSAGDDLILGEGGRDFLIGGRGSDVIVGGAESDLIWAGTSEFGGGDPTDADTVYGDDGDPQTPTAGEARDVIFGSAGADMLYGEGGNDSISGGSGGDTIDGGDGADDLFGNRGNDKIFGGRGEDELFGGSGADDLHGGANPDTLWFDIPLAGQVNPDRFYGHGFDDSFDTVLATADMEMEDIDILQIGGTPGDDRITIGRPFGSDLDATTLLTIEYQVLPGPSGTGGLGPVSSDIQWRYFDTTLGELVPRVEKFRVDAAGGNDVVAFAQTSETILDLSQLIANDSNNTNIIGDFFGSDGNDVLVGGTGRDLLIGGAGNDFLFGREGDDRLWGDDPDDNRTPPTLDGDDFIYAGRGNDDVLGEGGDDTLFATSRLSEPTLIQFAEALAFADFFGLDLISTADPTDRGLNRINAGEGDDDLYGGFGADFLFGGPNPALEDNTIYDRNNQPLAGDANGLDEDGVSFVDYAATLDNAWTYRGSDAVESARLSYVTAGAFAGAHFLEVVTEGVGQFVEFRFSLDEDANDALTNPDDPNAGDEEDLALKPFSIIQQALTEGIEIAEFDVVVIDLQGGADLLLVTQTVRKTVWSSGGDGNDTLLHQISGFASSPTRPPTYEALFNAVGDDLVKFEIGLTNEEFNALTQSQINAFRATVAQQWFDDIYARRDVALGGDGNDTIAGTVGEDWIFGEAGNDVLFGGLERPADISAGDQRSDLIDGGPGDDVFQIIPDFEETAVLTDGSLDQQNTQIYDLFIGGSGVDQALYYASYFPSLTLPGGEAVEDFVFLSFSEADQAYELRALSAGAQSGEFLEDPIDGDFLLRTSRFQGSGVEHLAIDVRGGDDIVHLEDGWNRDVLVELTGLGIGIEQGPRGARSIPNIQVRAGFGDDFVIGSGMNDAIYGQEGDDVLEGRDGDDLLDGGDGDDSILGDDYIEQAPIGDTWPAAPSPVLDDAEITGTFNDFRREYRLAPWVIGGFSIEPLESADTVFEIDATLFAPPVTPILLSDPAEGGFGGSFLTKEGNAPTFGVATFDNDTIGLEGVFTLGEQAAGKWFTFITQGDGGGVQIAGLDQDTAPRDANFIHLSPAPVDLSLELDVIADSPLGAFLIDLSPLLGIDPDAVTDAVLQGPVITGSEQIRVFAGDSGGEGAEGEDLKLVAYESAGGTLDVASAIRAALAVGQQTLRIGVSGATETVTSVLVNARKPGVVGDLIARDGAVLATAQSSIDLRGLLAGRYYLHVYNPVDSAGASPAGKIQLTGLEGVGTYNAAFDTTYVFIEPTTWANADAHARSVGAQLVTIDSQAENDFIQSFVAGRSTNVWIGLNDRLLEGEFEWSSGDPVTYVNWAPGEPNNAGAQSNEDAVELSRTNGLWNDLSESQIRWGLMEFEGRLLDRIDGARVISDAKYNEATDSTYVLIDSGAWSVAQAWAVAHGGYLATIDSAEENAFIFDSLRDDVTDIGAYIGLNDLDSEGDFVWASGDPLIYENWAPGEPNNAGDEDLVEMVFQYLGSDGRWNDTSTTARQAIVEFDGFVPIGRPLITDGPVVNEQSGNTYYVTQPGTIAQVELTARALGGDLVAIGDAEEQAFVQFLANGRDVWIGLNDALFEGEFEWSNGEFLQYANWNFGQPGSDGDYVFLSGATGLWDDVPASSIFSAVIEVEPGRAVAAEQQFDFEIEITPPSRTAFLPPLFQDDIRGGDDNDLLIGGPGIDTISSGSAITGDFLIAKPSEVADALTSGDIRFDPAGDNAKDPEPIDPIVTGLDAWITDVIGAGPHTVSDLAEITRLIAINPDGVSTEDLSFFTSLRTLSIANPFGIGSGYTGAGWDAIGGNGLEPSDPDFEPGLQRLEHLSVANAPSFTAGYSSIGGFESQRMFPTSLRTLILDFTRPHDPGDNIVNPGLFATPSLETLTLRAVGVDTLDFGAALPNLRLLGLRNSSLPTLAPLTSFPSLKLLDLRNSSASDLTTVAGQLESADPPVGVLWDTSGATRDNIAPKVTGFRVLGSPASTGTALVPDSSPALRIDFNQQMFGSLDLFELIGPFGERVPLRSVQLAGQTSLIIRAAKVALDGEYTLRISPDLVDQSGNRLGAPVELTFAIDATPPTVTLEEFDVAPLAPVNGQPRAQATFTLRIVDGSGVDPASLSQFNLLVTNDGAPILVNAPVSLGGDLYAYTTNASFALSQGDLTVSLAGPVALKDLLGNTVSGSTLFATLLDLTAPTASLLTPSVINTDAGFIDVRYDDAFGFIDPSTINADNIAISGGVTIASASIIGTRADSIDVRYFLTGALPQGEFTVTAGASPVLDLAANPVAAGAFGAFAFDSSALVASLVSTNLVFAVDPGFVDVLYDDGSGLGVDPATIGLDDIEIDGVTIDRVISLGAGVYRYFYADDGQRISEAGADVRTVAGAVSDLADNPVAGSTLGSLQRDVTAPIATLLSPAQGALGAAPAFIDVRWDDTGVGVDVATIDTNAADGVDDISITIESTAGVQQVQIDSVQNMGGGVYRYALTLPTDEGLVRVRTTAGAVADTLGNASTAALAGVFSIDRTGPSITLVSPLAGAALPGGAPITTITIRVADPVSGVNAATVNAADFTVRGAAAQSIADLGGGLFELTLAQPLATDGAVQVALVGQVLDLQGNASATGSVGSFTIDSVGPVGALTGGLNGATLNGDPGHIDIRFTDALTGVDPASVTKDSVRLIVTPIGGGAPIELSFGSVTALGGGVFRFDLDLPQMGGGVTTVAMPSGVIEIRAGASAVRDLAGNAIAFNTLIGAFTLDVDDLAPTIEEITIAGGDSRSNVDRVEIVFSEAMNIGELLASGVLDSLVQLRTDDGTLLDLDDGFDRLAWNAAARRLTVDLTIDGFGGSAQTLLDDGRYQLRLRTAFIGDSAGNQLADTDGVNDGFLTIDRATGASTADFFQLLGDLDGSGSVNFADLNAVIATFNQSGAGVAGDTNGDGLVNFTDLNTILVRFGVVLP